MPHRQCGAAISHQIPLPLVHWKHQFEKRLNLYLLPEQSISKASPHIILGIYLSILYPPHLVRSQSFYGEEDIINNQQQQCNSRDSLQLNDTTKRSVSRQRKELKLHIHVRARGRKTLEPFNCGMQWAPLLVHTITMKYILQYSGLDMMHTTLSSSSSATELLPVVLSECKRLNSNQETMEIDIFSSFANATSSS